MSFARLLTTPNWSRRTLIVLVMQTVDSALRFTPRPRREVGSLGRAIGLDLHRDFCRVAIVESGALRSAGRIATTPQALELFAQSLAPTDRVALEVTGSAWEIARILEPHVARVIVVSPADTGIRQARAKTDRLDARALARLLAAGELDGVWSPDEPRVLRRRLARREQLVRARSRAKNEIHAALVRRLVGRPPVSDFWRDFHARLLSLIARRVRDRDSAEDILQDVMLRIHGHAGELERSAAVGAWVHQIARNAIADHYRKASIRHERPSGIDLDRQEPLVLERAPGEHRSELTACLGPLLERLPPLHREALALTELEGLTQASAAARLGLSSSGMKSRVQRGRAQLKDLLTACCEIELDRRGGVRSYRPLDGSSDCRPGDCRTERRSCRNADTASRPDAAAVGDTENEHGGDTEAEHEGWQTTERRRDAGVGQANDPASDRCARELLVLAMFLHDSCHSAR